MEPSNVSIHPKLLLIITFTLIGVLGSLLYMKGGVSTNSVVFSSDGLSANCTTQVDEPWYTVDFFDQELNMPMGSYTIPASWRLVQDMKVNPQYGNFTRFTVAFVGPQGEYARQYDDIIYYSEDSLEQWKRVATDYMQDELDKFTLGDFKPSERTHRSKIMQTQIQQALAQGDTLSYLEASVSGYRHGQEYRGIVLITNRRGSSWFGTQAFSVSLASCPKEQFSQMMQTIEKINESYQENPDYKTCYVQVQDYLNRVFSYHDDYRRYDRIWEWPDRNYDFRKMASGAISDTTCHCPYFDKPYDNYYYTRNDQEYIPSVDDTFPDSTWYSPDNRTY